jgi:LacI family transcriptional regulator
MKKLEYILLNNKSIRGIFVTNSQVYYVGRIIQKLNIKGIRIIGHDLINENVKYLNEDIIDFLVCQRPEEQGYQSIITLFDFLILNKDSKKDNFTSIDIISKENINYYK